MIRDAHPILQAFLGTLFTWAVTALGSAGVFVLRGNQRKFLDTALGFAAGVMLAASFWSLLTPAIEHAQISGTYGESGKFAFAPVIAGFFLGALFCYSADKIMSRCGVDPSQSMLALATLEEEPHITSSSTNGSINSISATIDNVEKKMTKLEQEAILRRKIKWKRVILLVTAVTVHNIPEGLAVGVAFGSIGSSESATFESARNLALGIGIQNFPEGLVVSMPLHAAGYGLWKSFFYGQLSGVVEPVFGVLGGVFASLVTVILPYALSFAASCMIYVVADDILPESQENGNGTLATWGLIIGFIIMMFLECGGDRLILGI